MNFNDFNSWTQENYSFDCFENELFKQSLYHAFNTFKSSTIDGVSYLEVFQDNLYPNFLKHYLTQILTLIKMIPVPDSGINWNVCDVHLNDFVHQKADLSQRIGLLASQLLD